MAWTPITGTFIQYSEDNIDANGFYLKFYASGTTTPISMATDSTGTTILDKCQLDPDGMPINGSGGALIPHIEEKYKLLIYRNAADADANTFANAYKEIDGVNQFVTSDTGQSPLYSDQGINNPTMAGNLRYSIIAGGSNNSIDQGSGILGDGDGVTISGGKSNTITATFDGDFQGATISGGQENTADGYWVTIAGGKSNSIVADIVNYSFIGGGDSNEITGTQAFLSVVGGGRNNHIQGDVANRCFIGGGGENTISGTQTSRAAIVGGEDNKITGNTAFYSFIGGGKNNQISGGAAAGGYTVIGGGLDNQISGSTCSYSIVVGGQLNGINASSGAHAIIVGGRENEIQNNAQYSLIVGGYLNKINGQRSFVGGGYSNDIATPSGTQNAIVGGNGNKMLSNTVQNSFIGGGFDNEIGVLLSGTALVGVSILGGEDNIAIGSRASMLGGLGLRADSYMEVVKGTYNDPANPDGIGTPSKTVYTGGQIAEALGIGTSDVARANAYVWLKDGKQIRYNTPVYADNTAAAASELVGTVYRTSTGTLMQVF